MPFSLGKRAPGASRLRFFTENWPLAAPSPTNNHFLKQLGPWRLQVSCKEKFHRFCFIRGPKTIIFFLKNLTPGGLQAIFFEEIVVLAPRASFRLLGVPSPTAVAKAPQRPRRAPWCPAGVSGYRASLGDPESNLEGAPGSPQGAPSLSAPPQGARRAPWGSLGPLGPWGRGAARRRFRRTRSPFNTSERTSGLPCSIAYRVRACEAPSELFGKQQE